MKIKKALFYGFILVFLNACTKNTPQKNQEEGTGQNVTQFKQVSVIQLNDFQKTFNQQLTVNALVRALQKTELRFKTGDRLNVIKVANGKLVAQGQRIASLENSLLENNLNKVKIDLEKANNKLAEEKINYGQDNLTPAIRKSLEIKSGVFLEAKNNLQRAKIEYEQTVLKAPFSGLIANLEKKQGDYGFVL